MEASPDTPVLELLGGVVRDVERLCAEAGVNGTLGLNLMLSDGRWVYGSRLGRSLHYLCRDGIRDCEICGFPHVHHDPSTRYRAVVVDSEPITHEPWCEMQERSLYEIGPDARIRIESL
jgi:glutamine amidotransferase